MHLTRNACASLLVALDVHPRVAMQILRHSKIAVTMEVYAGVVSVSTKDALRQSPASSSIRVIPRDHCCTCSCTGRFGPVPGAANMRLTRDGANGWSQRDSNLYPPTCKVRRVPSLGVVHAGRTRVDTVRHGD